MKAKERLYYLRIGAEDVFDKALLVLGLSIFPVLAIWAYVWLITHGAWFGVYLLTLFIVGGVLAQLTGSALDVAVEFVKDRVLFDDPTLGRDPFLKKWAKLWWNAVVVVVGSVGPMMAVIYLGALAWKNS